jgi:hypothetical protein
MVTTLRRAGAVVFAASMLAACSMLGGSGGGSVSREPETASTIGHLATECARLQPLYGPNDTELTREQMDAGLKAAFAKWDTDSNGELSSSETEPVNDQLRAENVGASPVTDWNADGRVDFKEFASGWRTMFDLCDSNRNKIVSLRELGFSPNVAAPRTAAPTKPPEGASAPPTHGGGY